MPVFNAKRMFFNTIPVGYFGHGHVGIKCLHYPAILWYHVANGFVVTRESILRHCLSKSIEQSSFESRGGVIWEGGQDVTSLGNKILVGSQDYNREGLLISLPPVTPLRFKRAVI